MRLDVFVAISCNMSRSAARVLIDKGDVLVDGGHRKASLRLTYGQRVEVCKREPKPTLLEPENIPISVLYEDDDIAVINKHAGLIVHPAGSRRSGTLVNALLHRWGSLFAPGAPDRPGIVHRLDEGTTGLIIVTRNERAYWDLVQQFQERSIKKYYRAIVWGIPSMMEGIVNLPIGRHPRHRQKMSVVMNGKEARTAYKITRTLTFVSELTLELFTGRTHQIRVHLSSLNHPVVGDTTYGGRRRALRHVAPGYRKQCRELLSMVKRPLLHAETLVFRHPRSGDLRTMHAPLPKDFTDVIDWICTLSGKNG